MPDSILEKRIHQKKQYFQRSRGLLKKLYTEGQQPEALFITCSDSRIMIESMLGLQAGDFFVHRNIAACVSPYDQPDVATTAVLEFAVMGLKVNHIIVCGHTDCGGVLKADEPPDNTYPALTHWLDHIHPARQTIDATMPNLSPNDRHRAIVERHIMNQLANLRSYPYVAKAENQASLTLHGWVEYLGEQTLRYYDPQNDLFIE